MRNRISTILMGGMPFLIGLTGCQTGSLRPALTVLDKSLEPLRERFNADKERIRVVALFSPV